MKLEYSTPYGYMYKDKNWLKKFALASLLTYTLIGAAPVFGWAIEIVRRVARGEEPIVPELDDWGLYWKLGGKFAFANALWLLPLLLATVLLYLPLIFANQIPPELLLFIFGAVLLCVIGFLFVYSIVYAYFIPVMMVSLANGDSAWQAANPVHLWRLARPRLGGYLMLYLVVGVGMVNLVVFLSAFTLFLLLPPLVVYLTLVTAHFAGQLGMKDDNEPAAA